MFIIQPNKNMYEFDLHHHNMKTGKSEHLSSNQIEDMPARGWCYETASLNYAKAIKLELDNNISLLCRFVRDEDLGDYLIADYLGALNFLKYFEEYKRVVGLEDEHKLPD